MPGHVFIVRGDLRRLMCDGWLMPAGRDGKPEPKWLRKDTPDPAWPDPTADYLRGLRRVLDVPDWPDDRPRPWLVNLDAGLDTPPDWFLDGARQFLAAAAPAVKPIPVTRRAKP